VTNCTCTAPSAPTSDVSPDVEPVTSSMAPSRTGANVKKLVPPLRNRSELLLMPSSRVSEGWQVGWAYLNL
jgi:hypothetical protein